MNDIKYCRNCVFHKYNHTKELLQCFNPEIIKQNIEALTSFTHIGVDCLKARDNSLQTSICGSEGKLYERG